MLEVGRHLPYLDPGVVEEVSEVVHVVQYVLLLIWYDAAGRDFDLLSSLAIAGGIYHLSVGGSPSMVDPCCSRVSWPSKVENDIKEIPAEYIFSWKSANTREECIVVQDKRFYAKEHPPVFR